MASKDISEEVSTQTLDKFTDLDKNQKIESPFESDSKNDHKNWLVLDEDSTDMNEICTDLLKINEVIRDSVHGDIGITLLEIFLIDSPIFQRLRGISQLGPTQLVYPGAVHTRFQHSLGTLYVAENLTNICNQNYDSLNKHLSEKVHKIIHYEHLIIRLSALLHDLAHVPFGHTLEDEGNLFLPEWEDDSRLWILDEKGPIYECISLFLEKFEITDPHLLARRINRDLADVLIGKPAKISAKTRIPFKGKSFVKDIISGNVGADLLDYSQRDMLFCGLSERWGDRFVRHLAVLNLKKKEAKSEYDVFELTEFGETCRLVLLGYRYEQDPKSPTKSKFIQKMDVITEAIDLLRKRYVLSEKVYFHRTKIAASSMLISAVGDAKINSSTVFNKSEQELIAELIDLGGRAGNLACAYKNRNLYKPIYEVRFKEEDESDKKISAFWGNDYKRYRDPEFRSNLEEYMEKTLLLKEGSISIYCPERKMNSKKFKMLVQMDPEKEVKPLRYILDDNRKQEMDVIENKFEPLWKLRVFVDPTEINPYDSFNPRTRKLIKLCEDLFNFYNERDIIGQNCDERIMLVKKEGIIDRVITDIEKNDKFQVPVSLRSKALTVAKRPNKKVLSFEEEYKEWSDWFKRELEIT